MPFNNKGVIGFMSLLIIMLIAATTVSKMTLEHYQDIRRASISKAKARALILAVSTEQYYAKLFEDEQKESSGLNSPAVDSYLENWALALPFLPVADGRISTKIYDLQAKVNINNLAQLSNWNQSQQLYADGSLKANVGNILMSMYAAVNPEELNNPIAALIDWIDPNTQPIAGGAEDFYYLGQSPSYRVANTWFSDLSEMNLVRGFDHQIVNQLKNWVTVIPISNALININTANPRVLAWFILQFNSNLSLLDQKAEVERISAMIPFENVDEFLNEISNNFYYSNQGVYQQKRDDIVNMLSVTSQYYLLETRIEILDYNIVIMSHMYRNNAQLKTYRREMFFLPQYIPLDDNNEESEESSLFDIDAL